MKIMYIIMIIIILLIVILSIVLPKGYIKYYKSIPVYPNNTNEAKLVKNYINLRRDEDIDFFHLTNISVVDAFVPHVNKESRDELLKITESKKTLAIVYFFKYLINRARPEQVDDSIKPINTDTAKTPAYPAGHAYQAYLLAKVLSQRYPDKSTLFNQLAIRCDLCRVQAGIHYPSDGKFSKRLVDFFN